MNERALFVGVTGHRPNRIAIGEAETARRVALVLRALRTGAGGRRPIAFSALAEGADRIFAEEACKLGYRLQVILPFESGLYETTFSDHGKTAEYRTLLGKAVHASTLAGDLNADTSAYEAVGRAVAEASDVLITVWDGRPAAGRGGTAEILEYALSRGKPIIWIDATRQRLPRLIRAPLPPAALPSLQTLSRRAKSVTTRSIIQIACCAW